MDSDYYTNNKEAAVIGALLADELFLQGVDKNQTSIPHFKVMDYDSWAGTPSQIFIDRDLDGKADGEANIIYDFFGELQKIEIDRNRDGVVDATFDCINDLNSITLEFDDGCDGVADAEGQLQAYSGRSMQFNSDDANRAAGSITFVQGFQGPGGILVDVEGNGLNDLKGSIARYVPEAKVTSFGNS